MVILANKTGETDGSLHNMLLNVKSDMPIVLVSRPNHFEFNEQLLTLDRYCLVDCCEYGWDVEFENTHIFGRNTNEFAKYFIGEEWERFDKFIAEKPPCLYLKRELLAKDVADNPYPIKPIEYAGWFEPPPIVSREEFEARPIQVFFSWGYSSEYRRQLHGKIWTEAHKYGYMVCDNLYYLNGFLQHEENPKKWVTTNVPHFNRHPMNEVLGVNGMAKISISHWGAGKKCFRNCEASLNAVMALPFDNYAWTFDWVHGGNCIKFYLENTVEQLVNHGCADLYEVYKNGVETCRKYYLPNYCRHLEKLINEL